MRRQQLESDNNSAMTTFMLRGDQTEAPADQEKMKQLALAMSSHSPVVFSHQSGVPTPVVPSSQVKI
jgi:hypothetical protein